MIKWLNGWIVKLLLFLYFFISLFLLAQFKTHLWVQPVYAVCVVPDSNDIGVLQRAEEECRKEIDARMGAHVKNKEDLEKLKANLETTKQLMQKAEIQINALEKEIFDQEVELGYQQELLAARVRSYYKKSRQSSILLVLFASSSANELLRDLSYRQAAADQDKKIIVDISQDLKKLNEGKNKLEDAKAWLAKTKSKLSGNISSLEIEVEKVESYFSDVRGKIAELSRKQQELLAQKLAGLNLPTSLGAGPLYCTDDRNIDPGFAPAFAFYTFGIPHRVGMNQYGAYGRAQAGQPYQDILRVYFEGISFEKRPNININVQGYGSMPLEQYLLGIYEMPESWPLEALKAQAVAARSYALAYTHNGANEICTTQKCQVYKGGNKGGNWEAAVRATEGEVMVHGGQVITAWYASTAGGYTYLSSDVGWNHRPWTKRMRDTSGDVGSFEDLQSKAYDRDSPCFYAAQGWRSQYSKSAWLKSEEVADIVNILLLAKRDSGAQKHLSQIDKPNPDGVETWDAGRVRQELTSRGGTPYSQVSSVSVDWDKGLGRTTSVNVSGNAGSQTFDGNEFKDYFNLRAPANIQIVGPLYKVEKKG